MASLGAGRASGQGEGQGAPSFGYRTELFLTGKNLEWGKRENEETNLSSTLLKKWPVIFFSSWYITFDLLLN